MKRQKPSWNAALTSGRATLGGASSVKLSLLYTLGLSALSPAAGLRSSCWALSDLPTEKVRFATVDEYIAAAPEDVRDVLEAVRQTIREAAPGAVEAISYNIPSFKLGGSYLVYFSAAKRHIGVYPRPEGPDDFEAAIEPYKAGKGTVRFPLGQPIPHDLLTRMVALLKQANEARQKR